MTAHLLGVGTPALLDRNVARRPSELLQLLPECSQIALPQRRADGGRRQHADLAHALALLRPRRDRPRRCPAEQRDELAPPDHSITSSASNCIELGTSMPSALAACKLITNSNLVDCATGRSVGFSPLIIRPT